MAFHPLNAELNPICYLLTLLGDHPIFHISRIRVNGRKLYFLPLLVIAVSLETFGKPSYVCILKFLCRIRNYFYIGSYTIVFSIITITLQSLLIHVLFAGGRNAKTAHKLSCVSLLAALYFYVYLYHSAVIFFFFFFFCYFHWLHLHSEHLPQHAHIHMYTLAMPVCVYDNSCTLNTEIHSNRTCSYWISCFRFGGLSIQL